MRRGLVWTGVGLVAVLAIVWRSADSASREERRTEPAVKPSPSTPAQAPSPALRAQRERLLTNDQLPPPGPGASDEEWAEYIDTLQAIEAGKDPIVHQPRSPQAQEMESRVRERTRQAKENLTKVHDEHKVRLDQMRQRMAEVKERHARKVGPRPAPPQGARPPEGTPDLGPGFVPDEPEKK